jgi:citronellyl-CoA dehydrogenase
VSFFSSEHDAFREHVRGVLDTEVGSNIEKWEHERSFEPHEVFPQLAAAGLLGLEYDPAVGGGGHDHRYTVVFGEELGRMGCNGAAMSIAIQTDMATPSLAMFGSPDIKERFLRPALQGRLVGAVAISEPGAGSDVAAITSSAVRDGDDWIISGQKRFITNGAKADWVCTLVRTSQAAGTRGMTQIVVPTETPGFSVEAEMDKLGGRPIGTVQLRYDECRVPVANTVGEEGRGFSQQMRQLQPERMIANYIAVGESERAIERTAEYLQERSAFGKTLINSQYLQFELAELVAELEVLKQYNYACAQAYLDGEDTGRATTIAKLTAGRLVRKIADRCLQFHGGIGYDDAHWVARFFRDSRLLSIGGGTDEIMLRIIAKLEGWPVVF